MLLRRGTGFPEARSHRPHEANERARLLEPFVLAEARVEVGGEQPAPQENSVRSAEPLNPGRDELPLVPLFGAKAARSFAWTTRHDPTARASSLRLPPQARRNGLALAADTPADDGTSSAPPGAEAPARLKWDERQLVPTI